MTLDFTGGWKLWQGALLGAALAVAAWRLYRREMGTGMLPGLRAGAVLMAVMMLTGPVLHHRKVTGERARVIVFVDASESMGLADPSMETGRKLLAARRRGWIPGGALDTRPVEAAEALGRARRDPAAFGREIEAAAELMAGSPAADRFRDEVRLPARDPAKAEAAAHAAGRWERDLRLSFEQSAVAQVASGNPELRAAVARFDGLSRWKRAEAILGGGLLERLEAKHRVEVRALTGPLPGGPAEKVTNLADGISARLGDREEGRVAAVLLSDGGHNDGGSPLALARMLGSRGIPLFTIGMGVASPPPDLAVLEVNGPVSVFYRDRLKGEIILKDDMPPGRPFVARLESGGTVLWTKSLITDGSHRRSVPFDFAVQPLAEKRTGGRGGDLQVLSLPLEVTASVSPVEGELEPGNNARALHTRVTMQRRKLLLLDGRSRWEFRYLRNLFERDPQWEVNAILADRTGPGRFPADRDALFAYDLIIFGEVPRQTFTRMEELVWIREFVEKRGGGIIFIDGRRGHLGTYAEAKELGPLFPVDWKTEPAGIRPASLRLSRVGALQGALSLASEPARNAELWSVLAAPHWVAPSRALPGSEVLVEAVAGERAVPALAFRRFGAGRVLYVGIDETWRWRYEVGDRYHEKFWSQAARWIMEPPFAVRDRFAAIDASESGDLRVRLWDAGGRPVSQAGAEAYVFRGDAKVVTVRLVPDENAGGLFHGAAGALPPGRYEVAVGGTGLPETARAEFVVRPRDAGERALLTCDEDLLRSMAAQSSRGEYLREEESDWLEGRLEPLSQEKIVETDTALWQSWWWFLPLVGLLTVEWGVRKWRGLV